MHKISTRTLWAKQTQVLKWGSPDNGTEEWILAVGRELTKRTDTSMQRRMRSVAEQENRRLEGSKSATH